MSLVLNLCPIQFDDREIGVGRLPYGNDGDQVLEQLREKHGHTHVFRREGADSIFSVGVVSDARLIGEPRTIRLKEHLGLAAALIRDALLNYLTGLDRIVMSYDPLRFIARENLLQGIMPEGVSCPEWLGVRLMFELAIRPINFLEQEPFVAAVLDVGTTVLIERTAAQLMEDGIRVDGLYVGRRLIGHDSRIAPRIKPVGRLGSVNGTEIRLVDSRDGTDSIEADQACLVRRAFGTCLSRVFKQRSTGIITALRLLRASVRQGKARFDRITNTLEFLRKQQYEMIPGLPFVLAPVLDESMTSFPRLEPAPGPVYVFDPNKQKTSTGRDGGLNKHGPYTAPLFSRSKPRICVVCEQSKEEQVKEFLDKFVHGLRGYRRRPRGIAERHGATTLRRASAGSIPSRVFSLSFLRQLTNPATLTRKRVNEPSRNTATVTNMISRWFKYRIAFIDCFRMTILTLSPRPVFILIKFLFRNLRLRPR